MQGRKRQAAYQKGVDAERIAARYFEKRWFDVLQHRYKTTFGEIDLVVAKDEQLIFVEVKAHSDATQALYAVTEKSRRRIEQAALQFISEHEDMAGYDMRFDVIVVPETALRASDRIDAHNLLGEDGVHHLDNAWLAGQ